MMPEEISRQADKQRQKITKLHQPEPAKEKKPGTYDAFSFYTYARIYPGKMNFMLWFLLCVPATVFLCLFIFDGTGKWSLYLALLLYAIFLVRCTADGVMKLRTYPGYRNFPSELGFHLEGWDKLGSYPDQLRNRYWSKCTTVEISLKGSTGDDARKLINDALFLFNTNANNAFYQAEPGGDGRYKWRQEHPLKVKGSSNAIVIGHMYTLLTEYLKSIQSHYQVITAVKIEFDPEIFEVNPPGGD